jgi:hypothetical protein
MLTLTRRADFLIRRASRSFLKEPDSPLASSRLR